MRFPDAPSTAPTVAVPTSAPALPAPELSALLAMLDGLTASLHALRVAMQAFYNFNNVRFLTCEEFITRWGGKLTVETLQDYIRGRKHGRFQRVVDLGKGGYRIPEYYLLYTDSQVDALLGHADTSAPAHPMTRLPVVAGAVTTTLAEREGARRRSNVDEPPVRSTGPKGQRIARHAAEALLDAALADD